MQGHKPVTSFDSSSNFDRVQRAVDARLAVTASRPRPKPRESRETSRAWRARFGVIGVSVEVEHTRHDKYE